MHRQPPHPALSLLGLQESGLGRSTYESRGFSGGSVLGLDGWCRGVLTVMVSFMFDRWNQPDLAGKMAIIVPVDVLGDGDLEIVDGAPGPFSTDDFGLEWRVHTEMTALAWARFSV